MNEIDRIKSIVSETVDSNLSRTILFGSRANGTFQEGSDYDLLIVVKNTLERSEYFKLLKHLRQNFAEHNLNADIIVRSEEDMLFLVNAPGTTTYNAAKYGIAL